MPGVLVVIFELPGGSLVISEAEARHSIMGLSGLALSQGRKTAPSPDSFTSGRRRVRTESPAVGGSWLAGRRDGVTGRGGLGPGAASKGRSGAASALLSPPPSPPCWRPEALHVRWYREARRPWGPCLIHVVIRAEDTEIPTLAV